MAVAKAGKAFTVWRIMTAKGNMGALSQLTKPKAIKVADIKDDARQAMTSNQKDFIHMRMEDWLPKWALGRDTRVFIAKLGQVKDIAVDKQLPPIDIDGLEAVRVASSDATARGGSTQGPEAWADCPGTPRISSPTSTTRRRGGLHGLGSGWWY